MTGPQTPSDEELVTSYWTGREDAFDEIVARYRLKVFRLIYRFIGDGPRSEELTQETFIRVFRNIRRFQPRLKFSTWIYRIASNLARNEARDRRRRGLPEPPAPDGEPVLDRLPGSSLHEPDRALEQSETAQAVQTAVHRLPPKFREVFLLRELEGLSYEEIARVIRRPVGTVRSRVNRARLRFRDLLEPMLGGGQP